MSLNLLPLNSSCNSILYAARGTNLAPSPDFAYWKHCEIPSRDKLSVFASVAVRLTNVLKKCGMDLVFPFLVSASIPAMPASMCGKYDAATRDMPLLITSK